jgi:hypothetical protein
MRDLRLADIGLRYLARDHVYTFAADGDIWSLHGDRAATQASIAAISCRDTEAFTRFSAFCNSLLPLLGAVMDGPPPSMSELAALAGTSGRAAARIMHTVLASPRQPPQLCHPCANSTLAARLRLRPVSGAGRPRERWATTRRRRAKLHTIPRALPGASWRYGALRDAGQAHPAP